MEMTYEFLNDAIEKSFRKSSHLKFNKRNKHVKELSNSGITIVENFLDEEKCNEYYNKVKLILKENSKNSTGKVFTDENSMIIDRGKRFNSDFNMIDIFDIDKNISELEYLRNDKFILNTIHKVSNLHLKVENLNIYYNNEVNPRILHVDNFMKPQYKAFIYLTDVNCLEDGPYMYVKGSHLCTEKKILSYIDNYKNNKYATDMGRYEYDDAYPCIAKKGTLIISDQNGVHGAFPQTKGKERMLIMLNLAKTKINPK